MIKKYLMVGVALSSLSTGVYFTRLHYVGERTEMILQLERAEKENIKQVLNVERLQREKSIAIAATIEAEKTAREAKEKVIIKEVIKYVQVNSNAKCELDDDWVRISDAATPLPRTPITSGESNVTRDTVRNLGDALRVVTNNYSRCQDAVDRLEAWQKWWESIND